MANDVTAPLGHQGAGKSTEVTKLWTKDRIRDRSYSHFVPARTSSRRTGGGRARVCRKYDISLFFDEGAAGLSIRSSGTWICVVSRGLVIGADSHSALMAGLGLFSTGRVGSTDLAAVMATGEVWLKVREPCDSITVATRSW